MGTKVHPSFHFISRGSIFGTVGARVEIEISTSSRFYPSSLMTSRPFTRAWSSLIAQMPCHVDPLTYHDHV